jgi:hypothetical protein
VYIAGRHLKRLLAESQKQLRRPLMRLPRSYFQSLGGPSPKYLVSMIAVVSRPAMLFRKRSICAGNTASLKPTNRHHRRTRSDVIPVFFYGSHEARRDAEDMPSLSVHSPNGLLLKNGFELLIRSVVSVYLIHGPSPEGGSAEIIRPGRRRQPSETTHTKTGAARLPTSQATPEASRGRQDDPS